MQQPNATNRSDLVARVHDFGLQRPPAAMVVLSLATWTEPPEYKEYIPANFRSGRQS